MGEPGASGQRTLSRRGTALAFVTAAILLLPWIVGPAPRPIPRHPRVGTAARVGPLSWWQTTTYERIEAGLADRIRIRPWIRGVVANASYLGLGRSSSPQVVAGRDGWLFLGADFTNACGIAPERFRENLRTVIDRVDGAARTSGRPILFVVVPDKSASESARLGPWGRDALAQCSAPVRRVLEEVAAERSSLSLIAPETIARWGDGPSWTPGDTHWTPPASRALLDAVLTRRGVAADEARRIVESAARPRGVQFANDLYLLMELLGAGRGDPVASIVGAADTTVEDLKPSPAGRPHRRWITGRPARTAEREVVVIGDSFAEHPFPAIAATWACGTTATWDATTWESLPATADLVVLQSVERGMRRRVAQLGRPGSAAFWQWLSTPPSPGPSRTCPASGGS